MFSYDKKRLNQMKKMLESGYVIKNYLKKPKLKDSWMNFKNIYMDTRRMTWQ